MLVIPFKRFSRDTAERKSKMNAASKHAKDTGCVKNDNVLTRHQNERKLQV